MATLYTCSFEVTGQKYYWKGREFCGSMEEEANKLGVYGNCAPREDNTVKGELEAPLGPLNEMKEWLKMKGTPENVEFSPIKEIASYSVNRFGVGGFLWYVPTGEYFLIPPFPPNFGR